jgi:hypothetical protein
MFQIDRTRSERTDFRDWVSVLPRQQRYVESAMLEESDPKY